MNALNSATSTKLTLRAAALCATSLLLPLLAQPPVAPTREPVGEARGSNYGNYNLTQSWELGERFFTAGGNVDKYRSDVNYRNGLRLLSGRLALKSRDGKGHLFDELTLTTLGLGNDPYQSASLRIAKNHLYRYDLLYRSSDYFNPALAIAGGRHRMDTLRRMQDHDFTLLPQSRVRFFLGFSRNSQTGPTLTTVNVFDDAGATPLVAFADLRRRQNEFRFGNEMNLLGFRLNWMQSFDLYREESPTALYAPTPLGAAPDDLTKLTSFSRSQPYEGTTPRLRVNLFRERNARYAVNGRFTYSSGRRDFTSREAANGLDRFGDANNRQIAVTGDARRPVTTGNLTLSLFPTESLTLTNHTSFHNTRMEGRTSYTELYNGDLSTASLNFQSLGIRLITNSTDAQLQLRPWLALRGGFFHSQRRIRSVEEQKMEFFEGTTAATQTTALNAGTFGFRLRPAKPFTLSGDGELGRQDQAFALTAPKQYHSIRARAQYRNGPLTLSAEMKSHSDFNQASLFTYSARARHYGFDGSWSLRDGFSLEAGYARLHTATATGLAYFQAFRLINGNQSYYLSNLHSGHLGAHFSLRERIDLYAGLSTVHDAGGAAGTAPLPFSLVQTFPMAFDSPLARVSIRLHPKLRWNAGYQYYRYREELLALQNYRAHTAYTSLLWSF